MSTVSKAVIAMIFVIGVGGYAVGTVLGQGTDLPQVEEPIVVTPVQVDSPDTPAELPASRPDEDSKIKADQPRANQPRANQPRAGHDTGGKPPSRPPPPPAPSPEPEIDVGIDDDDDETDDGDEEGDDD